MTQTEAHFDTAIAPTLPTFRNLLVFGGAGAEVALSEAFRMFGAFSSVTLCDLRPGGRRFLASEAHARLQILANSLRDQRIEVRTKVLAGRSASSAMLREALQGGYDAVIKTATPRPRGFRSGAFREAPDARLLRRSPCPVVLARPRTDPSNKVIVAAIAPTINAGVSGEMGIPNSEILNTALELAEAEHLEVHVLRAWRAYGDGGEYVHSSRDNFWAALEAFLEQYRGLIPADRVHLLRGHPTTVIPRFAAENKAVALVMGAGSHRRMSAFLRGSKTENIVNNTDCSIVAVRPIEH